MDGVVRSHRLLLGSNAFLHQVICICICICICKNLHLKSFLHKLISSSWVAGEISTFLLPQHSVQDLLLEFSLELENACTAKGACKQETEEKTSHETSFILEKEKPRSLLMPRTTLGIIKMVIFQFLLLTLKRCLNNQPSQEKFPMKTMFLLCLNKH